MRWNVCVRSVLALALAFVVGCGGASQREIVDLPPPTPLSVEEWKALDVQEKYDSVAYERLQLGDPKLKDPRAWEKFEKEVIGPEYQKDHPPAG